MRVEIEFLKAENGRSINKLERFKMGEVRKLKWVMVQSGPSKSLKPNGLEPYLDTIALSRLTVYFWRSEGHQLIDITPYIVLYVDDINYWHIVYETMKVFNIWSSKSLKSFSDLIRT